MTRRALAAVALAVVLAVASAAEAQGRHFSHGHPGGFHPGFFHHNPRSFTAGPRVFIGGSFFWDPFFFPYYAPYYYPYPAYGYPPVEEEPEYGGPPPEAAPEGGSAEAPEAGEDALSATYGLIQLRGVPDGASVDLDGRFWLKANQLEHRWLAVPRGEHSLVVRVPGVGPVERRVDVAAGKNQVLRFGPFERQHG